MVWWQVGTYTLRYRAEDDSGNESEELKRTVTVVDINECELHKNHDHRAECHDAATCVNRVGSYDCACPTGYEGDGSKDGSGCRDTEAPEIILRGRERVTIGQYGDYDDNYAKCLDTADGDLTDDALEMDVPRELRKDADRRKDVGTYRVNFECRDRAGNRARIDRVVVVVNTDECEDRKWTADCSEHASCDDNDDGWRCECESGYAGDGQGHGGCRDDEPPVIKLRGDRVVEVDQYDEYDDRGAKAEDNVDERVDVKVEGGDVDTRKPGEYRVRYTAHDSTGNWADAVERVVVVNDINECRLDRQDSPHAHECHDNAKCRNTNGGYSCECESGFSGNGRRCEDDEAPSVALRGRKDMKISQYDAWDDPGIDVDDNVDDDDELEVRVDTPSELRKRAGELRRAGKYEVRYRVTDRAGNTAKESRTVTVQSFNECTSKDDELGHQCATHVARCVDKTNGYSCECYSGFEGDGFRCKDNEKPSLDLKGASTIRLDQYEPYEEPGWRASDNWDSDVDVRVAGEPDVSTPGTYKILYTARDRT